MNMKFVKVCAAFIAAASLSMPALAQDAKTLDELLEMIQSSKISESAEYRQREADFKRDQRKQAASLLRQRKLKLPKSVVQIVSSRIFVTMISSLPHCVSSVTSVSVH